MTIIYLAIAIATSIALFINKSKQLSHILISVFIVLQWLFTIYQCLHFNEIDSGYFKSDALAVLLLVTLSIICIPVFYHSYIFLKDDSASLHIKSVYYAATTLLITAISAAYLSNHIAVTWIFVEITTLSASLLIYHYRDELALEATWKYVFVCAISITFVFIGILFLSLAVRKSGITDISFEVLINNAKQFNIFWLRLAFLFIFTGFTAKLGIVPMFTAGIDAKDKAPSAAGAMFASVLMNVGFVGVFRVYVVVAQTSLHQWANTIIIITAIISLFVAMIYMTKVKNIKRMFAYSGLEHMSLVMLGLAAGGIGYYAAILHIILHAFVKSSLFFQYNQVYKIFGTNNIYQAGNYFKYNRLGAMVLLLGFLCAIAMPPSGMFVSELFIFKSLFQGHHILILILTMLFLTVIIFAFGRNLFKVLFIPLPDFKEQNVKKIPAAQSISQFLLLFLSIYLGINPPDIFVNLINEAIQLLPK